jgi:predicted RNA-binding protein with PIN domain
MRRGGSDVADPTLYIFDGYNLLHAGDYKDVPELVDRLASFVALQGARGVVVFDGHGEERKLGPLDIRYAPHADTLIERLAAENRTGELVCVVSSDAAIRGTSGPEVRKLTSGTFLRDLPEQGPEGYNPSRLGDRLDEATKAKLERLRRNQD